MPSPIDGWLEEIKSSPDAERIGMYLVHNGVVRGHSRDGRPVVGMDLSVDRELLAEVLESAKLMEGVVAVRAMVNEGTLAVGDDIMYVLVAGDIRPHVFEALGALVKMIKTQVVIEEEHRP